MATRRQRGVMRSYNPTAATGPNKLDAWAEDSCRDFIVTQTIRHIYHFPHSHGLTVTDPLQFGDNNLKHINGNNSDNNNNIVNSSLGSSIPSTALSSSDGNTVDDVKDGVATLTPFQDAIDSVINMKANSDRVSHLPSMPLSWEGKGSVGSNRCGWLSYPGGSDSTISYTAELLGHTTERRECAVETSSISKEEAQEGCSTVAVSNKDSSAVEVTPCKETGCGRKGTYSCIPLLFFGSIFGHFPPVAPAVAERDLHGLNCVGSGILRDSNHNDHVAGDQTNEANNIDYNNITTSSIGATDEVHGNIYRGHKGLCCHRRVCPHAFPGSVEILPIAPTQSSTKRPRSPLTSSPASPMLDGANDNNNKDDYDADKRGRCHEGKAVERALRFGMCGMETVDDVAIPLDSGASAGVDDIIIKTENTTDYNDDDDYKEYIASGSELFKEEDNTQETKTDSQTVAPTHTKHSSPSCCPGCAADMAAHFQALLTNKVVLERIPLKDLQFMCWILVRGAAVVGSGVPNDLSPSLSTSSLYKVPESMQSNVDKKYTSGDMTLNDNSLLQTPYKVPNSNNNLSSTPHLTSAAPFFQYAIPSGKREHLIGNLKSIYYDALLNMMQSDNKEVTHKNTDDMNTEVTHKNTGDEEENEPNAKEKEEDIKQSATSANDKASTIAITASLSKPLDQRRRSSAKPPVTVPAVNEEKSTCDSTSSKKQTKSPNIQPQSHVLPPQQKTQPHGDYRSRTRGGTVGSTAVKDTTDSNTGNDERTATVHKRSHKAQVKDANVTPSALGEGDKTDKHTAAAPTNPIKGKIGHVEPSAASDTTATDTPVSVYSPFTELAAYSVAWEYNNKTAKGQSIDKTNTTNNRRHFPGLYTLSNDNGAPHTYYRMLTSEDASATHSSHITPPCLPSEAWMVTPDDTYSATGELVCGGRRAALKEAQRAYCTQLHRQLMSVGRPIESDEGVGLSEFAKKCLTVFQAAPMPKAFESLGDKGPCDDDMRMSSARRSRPPPFDYYFTN